MIDEGDPDLGDLLNELETIPGFTTESRQAAANLLQQAFERGRKKGHAEIDESDREKREHIDEQSTHIGLMKRTDFEERVVAFFENERRRVHCAFGFLDITDFKEVNDECGHTEGDRVLVRIGNIVRSLYSTHEPYPETSERRFLSKLGPYDGACRSGGDEFMFFLGEVATLDDCRHIGYRVEREAAKISCTKRGGADFQLSIDIGIVYLHHDWDVVKDMSARLVFVELEKWADRLMYGAKRYAKTKKNPESARLARVDVGQFTISQLLALE